MADSVNAPADYRKCPAWPHGCLGCRYCVPQDVYFCRAYNRRHFGQERVQVELIADRSPWWMRERRRRGK